ncbi:hypothetical protein GSI_00522 [Ganoderma sinense ZZ0214-1]|uniref:WKF domain-containing protein n=1 Tax=Ganoderma sinense ZZ0214-1 TaxID=1077348 RepID=A0A2G8SSW9_9APHY|nr:hypothetical protein GSI_00522 [Ganoderma sinense ZZ0214-1]
MSASSVHKRPKKHIKSKDPLPEVGRQDGEDEKPRKSKKAKADKTSSSVSTPAVTDMIESSSEPAKETVRKKRKKTDGEGASESSQGVEDSGPKKKKKEHRREEEATEQVNGLQIEEDDGGRKKKKKRRESSTAESGEKGYQGEGGLGNEEVGDHRTDVKLSSSKKGKKEKKRKQSEDEGDMARPKEKSKKKRKHGSSSGFPNPSEDESLNDQARKALEYAFTQFEDPDRWKFHKARQNWLLRNIWSDETVPEKYVPLATRYLQGVQGGARETLIKACREALEPPKPAAANAETVEQEILPESLEADGAAKRTVTFTVDDKEDRNTVLPTHNTKRQRAASLLTVLTS